MHAQHFDEGSLQTHSTKPYILTEPVLELSQLQKQLAQPLAIGSATSAAGQ